MRDLIKRFLPLFAVALIAGGCGSYKKMASGVDKIGFTTTPEVPALCSGKVVVDLSVNFPPHYFAKDAVLQVTPVLSYSDGEIVFEPFMVQGEAIVANNTSVDFAKGGVVTENLVFDYKPAMRRSTLKVRVAICDGTQLVPVKVAAGELLSSSEIELVINEPKSAEAAKVLAQCDIVVAEGVSNLINMIDYKRSMLEVDDKMVEKVANQTIFEKGYTASLISAEDHAAARQLNNEGVKLAKSGKVKDAIEKFEAAKAKGVYLCASNRNLFLSYISQNKRKQAMEVYDIVDPVQRGVVYILNKEFGEAKELMTDGQTLAVLNLIGNDADAALKSLGKDNSSRAQYIRAIIYAKQGKKAEAKKAYDEAAKVKWLKSQLESDVNLISVAK